MKEPNLIKLLFKILNFLFLLSFFFIVIKSINKIKKNHNFEYNKIIEFISLVHQRISICPYFNYNKINNPKISIIIATFNAEPYINKALLSIQNQCFRNIEIIIVDDYSKDNTVNLIKKEMIKDQRINLYQNRKNRGTLTTKVIGILLSKGKYIMILDQDDIFTHKNVFKYLYLEIEINKLDLLGFSFIITSSKNFTRIWRIVNYNDSIIFYQPTISNQLYFFRSGKVMKKKYSHLLWKYIFKSELIKKVINSINKKFYYTKMNRHEDLLLFFLISRYAKRLKYINNICYNHIIYKSKNKGKVKYSLKQKYYNFGYDSCVSFLNYIEFLLIYTKNDELDKKIASYELINRLLNNKCRYIRLIQNKIKILIKLFMNNKYVNNNLKKYMSSLYNINNSYI